MDYTKRFFEYFSEDEMRSHIIIAPNAPPIERSEAGIEVAMDAILDDNDVTDTLVGLRTHGEGNALTDRRRCGLSLDNLVVVTIGTIAGGRFLGCGARDGTPLARRFAHSGEILRAP